MVHSHLSYMFRPEYTETVPAKHYRAEIWTESVSLGGVGTDWNETLKYELHIL